MTRQPNRPFLAGKKDNPGFDLLPKLINGGIAGVIGTAIMFPFDLTKTRIQNQVVGPNGERMYKSMIDCLRKIIKYEGIPGLYRGCIVSLVLIAPEKALKLTVNDFSRYYLQVPGKSKLSLSREVISGACAGLVQNLLTTPMDLLKIQLQDEGRVNQRDGNRLRAKTIAKDLIKEKGVLGLYKGGVVTTYRNVFFSVIYFPVFFYFEALGPRMKNNPKKSSSYWSFISGCAAGSIAAAAATPFDVVKTRMQNLGLGIGGNEHFKYTGTADALIKIYKSEGPLALMRGAGIRMLVIAPLFGIFQAVYYLGVGELLLGTDL